MPTYEYLCDACGHSFDEFQTFSDEPLTKCPQCNKKRLRRLFGTGSAILFKGSGFYQTDYRSDSYKAGEKKERETQTSSESAASSSAPSSNGTASANSSKTTSTEAKSK